MNALPGQGTILLVDDERMIRKAAKRMLEKLGYKVLIAEDGKQAIEIFQNNQDEVSLIILDLIMPVMDGVEALSKLREIDPTIRVLLLSGYSKEEIADELFITDVTSFMQKPFDLDTLYKELVQLLVSSEKPQ